MNIKLCIAWTIVNAVTLIISAQSFADQKISSSQSSPSASVNSVEKSVSSLTAQPGHKEMPNITNEAEYAEFVRQSDRAGLASSVKSSASGKSSLSNGSSSSRASVATPADKAHTATGH